MTDQENLDRAADVLEKGIDKTEKALDARQVELERVVTTKLPDWVRLDLLALVAALLAAIAISITGVVASSVASDQATANRRLLGIVCVQSNHQTDAIRRVFTDSIASSERALRDPTLKRYRKLIRDGIKTDKGYLDSLFIDRHCP
jgi:hypothetical protein